MYEFLNWSLIYIMTIGALTLATIIVYHTTRMLTGAYDADRRDRRIRGLENKLVQYSPHINWKTYKTDEEHYID